MSGHSFPAVSLGLPRWRPCQIPDPGPTLKCQNPYPGEGTLSQFPVGSPPPPPTLGLNSDRCINTLVYFWNIDLEIHIVLFIISCSTLVAIFFSTFNGNQSKLCSAQAKPTLQRLLTDYFKNLTNLQGDH